MKKLFLTMLAILLMAGASYATLAQTIAVVETTTSSMKIQDDYSVDGDVATIYLYWGTGVNLGWADLAKKDSIKAAGSPTDPDSFAVTGLKHNTNYSFAIVLRDSVYAHADSIHYDSTGITTVLTEGMTITLVAQDITYRSFQIYLELANMDSAAKKIVLEYRPGYGSYTRKDSATTINNSDDSLVTPGVPTDLSRNTYYDARVIVTDSTGTDTSAVTRVLTLDYAWGTWGEPAGWVQPGLYHLKDSWDNSGTTMSTEFPITDWNWVKIWVKLIGFDNNEANDSAYVYFISYAHNALVFSDTLITADVDTGRAVFADDFRQVGDSIPAAWGTNLVMKRSSSSGDTVALDTRYLEGWLMFRK